MYCIICKRKANKHKDNIIDRSHHRIPRNPVKYEKWRSILKMLGVDCLSGKNHRICSDHFQKTDFYMKNKRKCLHEHAVPNVLNLSTYETAVISVPTKHVICETGKNILINDAVSNTLEKRADETGEYIVCGTSSTFQGTLHKRKRSLSNANERPSNLFKKGNEDNTVYNAVCTSIEHDHDYYLRKSPRTLNKDLTLVKSENKQLKNSLKMERRRTKKLKKKILSITDLCRNLKQKLLISDDASTILENNFDGAQLQIIKRSLKNKKLNKPTTSKYSEELRKFALTLNFYSAKAYEYVRRSFNMALPHPATVRDWYSAINGEPGVTEESLRALSCIVDYNNKINKKTICSFILDAMSIKKKIEYDGKLYHGYVNIGTGVEGDSLPECTQALCFMVVAVNDNWKLPIAYFLIDSLNGNSLGNLVIMAISKLHAIGVNIISITCDGAPSNITMFKSLGAKINIEHPQPWIMHPITKEHIYCIFDICHMIKLIRNAWEYFKIIKDVNNEAIDYKYIELLYNLQRTVGLKAANKLSKKHIHFKKQIMKVNIAVQLLSDSVADALQFCKDDLKMNEFQGAGATINFIRIFNYLFDIGNSRNPFAYGKKAALRITNSDTWVPFLKTSLQYIAELKTQQNIPLVKTIRKTGFIGFWLTMISFSNIFDELIRSEPSQLKYLLTYKFSQDHIELFFCAIRGRGGWNNNPTAREFSYAYKKLLIINEVKITSGNTNAIDDTKILFVCGTKLPKITTKNIDITDINQMRKYETNLNTEEDYSNFLLNIDFSKSSEFLDNIITYVAGYAVKMVKKKIKCITCTNELFDRAVDPSMNNFDLLTRKNRGGLIVPSRDTVQICRMAEKLIKAAIYKFNKISKLDHFQTYIKIKILEKFGSNSNIFSNLNKHIDECTFEINHKYRLIEEVCAGYIKIRYFYEGVRETDEEQDCLIRKELSRLIIFKNQ